MTIPALALFYGGLVRTKNMLSLLMQCLVLTALMSILWLGGGYDDSLDVFGVHGVGGFTGTTLAGVFAADTFGGLGLAEGVSIGCQVGTQLLAATLTAVYAGVASFVLLKITGVIVDLRVDATDEGQGLDLSLHEEVGYNL